MTENQLVDSRGLMIKFLTYGVYERPPVANLPNRYSALCWRPVTHAQTWASYSALYRFGRLSPPAAKLGLGLQLSWPHWWPVGLLVEQHCRRTSGLFKYTLNIPVLLPTVNRKTLSVNNIKRQIFRIGTVHYAEGLWHMHRHGPVIAHWTYSEDFPIKIRNIKKIKNSATALAFWQGKHWV